VEECRINNIANKQLTQIYVHNQAALSYTTERADFTDVSLINLCGSLESRKHSKYEPVKSLISWKMFPSRRKEGRNRRDKHISVLEAEVMP
jgi:hypothetical protein